MRVIKEHRNHQTSTCLVWHGTATAPCCLVRGRRASAFLVRTPRQTRGALNVFSDTNQCDPSWEGGSFQ